MSAITSKNRCDLTDNPVSITIIWLMEAATLISMTYALVLQEKCLALVLNQSISSIPGPLPVLTIWLFFGCPSLGQMLAGQELVLWFDFLCIWIMEWLIRRMQSRHSMCIDPYDSLACHRCSFLICRFLGYLGILRQEVRNWANNNNLTIALSLCSHYSSDTKIKIKHWAGWAVPRLESTVKACLPKTA